MEEIAENDRKSSDRDFSTAVFVVDSALACRPFCFFFSSPVPRLRGRPFAYQTRKGPRNLHRPFSARNASAPDTPHTETQGGPCASGRERRKTTRSSVACELQREMQLGPARVRRRMRRRALLNAATSLSFATESAPHEHSGNARLFPLPSLPREQRREQACRCSRRGGTLDAAGAHDAERRRPKKRKKKRKTMRTEIETAMDRMLSTDQTESSRLRRRDRKSAGKVGKKEKRGRRRANSREGEEARAERREGRRCRRREAENRVVDGKRGGGGSANTPPLSVLVDRASGQGAEQTGAPPPPLFPVPALEACPRSSVLFSRHLSPPRQVTQKTRGGGRGGGRGGWTRCVFHDVQGSRRNAVDGK